MLLLFVAGVMNIWWIAIITVLVLIEKMRRADYFLAESPARCSLRGAFG
jgi:predicted metal-binding membrane protein